jgi:hypothetical protein
MKSCFALLSLLLIVSTSAFNAPLSTKTHVSLRSSSNEEDSSSTSTETLSPEAQREALERQYQQSSRGVKNADGSYGVPKGGYSKGEDCIYLAKLSRVWGGGGRGWIYL